MNDKKNRYEALSGLRTFSAFGILLMHVRANGNYKIDGFIFDKLIPSLTNLVFLFMIVSSFSMCCGYYEKIINGEFDPEKFYKKRFEKVWVYFAILCFLEFILSPTKEVLYEVFANLTLCFGLLPNAQISVIGVGWFLGLVFVFYMVFPFFCYLIANKKRAWLVFGIALAFNHLCEVYFRATRTNIVYSAVFFFLGGLVYLYRNELGKIVDKHRCAVLAGIGVAAAMYYMIGNSVFVMLLLYGSVLVYALGKKTRYTILDNKITNFISSLSLEIYLSHMVIFRIIEKIRMIHLMKSEVGSYLITVLLTVIGAIMFSYIMRKLIDRLMLYKRGLE